jgi:hypothetical protein
MDLYKAIQDLYAKNEKADLTDREKKKLVDAVKEITRPWRRR